MRGQKRILKACATGFTIAELLVVIIVVGILATVVMVGYQRAQVSAENSKTLQAVNQYLKAITTYSVQNGAYPITTAYPCLGTQATCARVSGTALCFGTGTASYEAGFATTMGTIVSPLPEPSTQTINCAGSMYRGAYYNRNDATNGKGATIVYFLKGDQQCGTKYGTASSTKQDDMTRCVVVLPTLPS